MHPAADATGRGYRIEGLNGASGDHLLLPEPVGPVLNWLDGRHTVDDLSRRFHQLTGQQVETALFEALVDALARLHLIAWETGELEADLGSVRLPRHESCYLGYGPMLRSNLEALVTSVAQDESLHGQMTALLAPHIDLHRGKLGYAEAYGALGQHPAADLYVLLGTSHQATRSTFVGTPRTFRTPFGDLSVATDLLTALQNATGDELLREQRLHDTEHSLEFQALFIAFNHARHGLPMPRILPLLCGSLYRWVVRGTRPATDPAFDRFIHTLGDQLDAWPGRVCVVGGVDLAHLGPQFGHDRGLDPLDRHGLRQRDLGTLRHVCDLDPEGFWDDVTVDKNARNICGLGPTYAMLHLIRSRVSGGRLLHYDQAVDAVGNVVSFGAAGFYRAT